MRVVGYRQSMYLIRWNVGLWALLVLLAGAAMACGLALQFEDGAWGVPTGIFLVPAALIAMLLDVLSPYGGLHQAGSPEI